jgi:hypothetical protein
MVNTRPFIFSGPEVREILKKEGLYQRFACCLRHHREVGRSDVTEEMSAIGYIAGIEKATKEIAASDLPMFSLTSRPFRGYAYCLTPLGSKLWLQLRAYFPSIEEVYSNQVFNPHVTVLLRAFKRWGDMLLYYRVYDNLDLQPPEVRTALNRIARFVRRTCRSMRFKRIASNYQRTSAKNFQSSCGYMAALFKHDPQLLIVRVDLYFLPETGAWANIEEADACHEKFLRALRQARIVPDLKGYISKRSDGFRRGMHYHLLVAMDGTKHRDACQAAGMLGRYWVDCCTSGKKLGSFFSCYSKNEPYRFNGLGLMHVSDVHALRELRVALYSITRGDHQLKTGDGRDRNLRRGIKPRSMSGQTLPDQTTWLSQGLLG